VEHPDTLFELARQQRAQLIVDAERGRLAQASRRRPKTGRRSVLALVCEVQLPLGRRVRFRVGRLVSGFPR
jgi:hypothetical protein